MGLHTGKKTVAAAGTPVTLMSARTPASWCTVTALDGNAGPVYVGDSTVVRDTLADGKSYTGHKLVPGDFVNLREIGGTTYLDLKNVYVDADNNSDGVCFNYGVR